MSRRYLLISPCRDEAAYLERTIACVAAQSVLPSQWLVVDDGSTDETPRILQQAAQKYPFLRVVTRSNRGQRSVGPGVIDAFYHGLSQVDLDQYDYVCKLDTDLEFKPRYFERAFEYFEQDPWLGTISGKLHLRNERGELERERTGDENSVGPIKLFRTQCFKDIGGFVREVCWDGVDGHMARMRGWIACSTDDPELEIVHLRQMGSSHRSLWHGRLRWGRGKYFMGSTPYYVAAASLYRMMEKPYVVGGLGIFLGYVRAMLSDAPRMQDAEYLAFVRKFERDSLIFGKSRTARLYHDRIRREVRRARKSEPEEPLATAIAE